MPRRTTRRTLARGVYLDGSSLEVRVTVHGQVVSKFLPVDTDLSDAIAIRNRLKLQVLTDRPTPARHTLAADVPRYLKLHRHQASYKNKRAILQHWVDLYGSRGRHRIGPQDVLSARVRWLGQGHSPKTINHRVHVLRHLYATLDGPKAETPCDYVSPLPVAKTPIQRVTAETILQVDAELQRREQHRPKGGRAFDGAKTRARYRVLVSTGRRPSEIMRAQPTDVDLEARVWVVRDGKGGWSPGLYLNDDMRAAWRLFIEAKAWGKYNTSSFSETLRHAGWPAGVRLYQARHSTWIEAVERGADMADVQMGAGHRSLVTTRQYTGVRQSRMQSLSERLEGRFRGFPVFVENGDTKKG